MNKLYVRHTLYIRSVRFVYAKVFDHFSDFLHSTLTYDKIRCLFANYGPLYMVYNQKLTNAIIKKH